MSEIRTFLTEEGAPALIKDLTTRKPIERKDIAPILQKSFAQGGDDRAWGRMREFFMAAVSNDAPAMASFQKGFRTRAQEMVNSGEMETKALVPWNETTSSQGGYNVPPEFAHDLARNLGKYGYARRYFRNWGMKSNVLNVPGLLTKPSVAIYAENTAIADSIPTEDNTVLTAKKIASIFPITAEALEDSDFEVYSVMLDIFTEQFQLTEDQNAFQNANTNWNGLLWYGAGTLASSGAIAANGAIGVARTGSTTGGKTGYPQIADAAAATDSWNDLIYTLQSQPSALFEAGKFFIDQSVALAMFSMRDTQNRFVADIINGITYQVGLEGQPKIYFKGYEIVVMPKGVMLTYDASAHVSTPFTIFGNLHRTWSLMGTRGGFRVDTLREGTINGVSLAANDLQALRMAERVAFATARPNTLVVLRTDAS